MKSLFETTYINDIKLKNRFIRSATCENMADSAGHLTDKLFNLYKTLASGGVAMLITGNSNIFKFRNDVHGDKMLGIYDDSFIDEFRELTNMVHYNRCRISMEIVRKSCSSEIYDDISSYDMNCIIKEFGNASYRIKQSGFDALEINISRDYFLGKALSPKYSTRTDTYGESMKNGKKFLFEIYSEIRNRVGENFNIFVKVNSLDGEYIPICCELDRYGVNAIEISSNKDESNLRRYVSNIAERVKCPVVLGAFNRSIENMNEILNTTEIEYFSMSRPFICEPDLVNKWLNGTKAISSCTSCGNCIGKEGIRCTNKI
ncbi:NADH:flavin oxidoreductase [Clostridium sp. LBM24168]